MIKQLQFRKLLADRGYLISLGLMIVLVAAMVILAVVYVRPSELRVPVSYSRFDPKFYTLGQWYQLLTYIAFAFVVLVTHTLLSAKLYQIKGRPFALGYSFMGSLVLLIGLVFFFAIVRVVALTQ
jgi:preprotein translocase subunit SecY